MGLPKHRWEYIKNLGPSYQKVERPKFRWYEGRRPRGPRTKESYRGARRNALRDEKRNMQNYLADERWRIAMGRPEKALERKHALKD